MLDDSKVFPSEVEAFLRTHENVNEASVFSLSVDGFEKYICAWIILKDETQATTSKDIKSFCDKHLSSKRSPHFVKIVKDFPLGSTGKTLKTEMAKIYKKELYI